MQLICFLNKYVIIKHTSKPIANKFQCNLYVSWIHTMRMTCSCVLMEPPVCKEPPVSDVRFFWFWIHLDRKSGEFHWDSKEVHTSSNIQIGFFPFFLASMNISNNLCATFEWKFFLILSSSSGFQQTFFLCKHKICG